MISRPQRILYIVSLNHAANDGSTALIASLFPILLLDFGFSLFQIGILVAAGYLMNVICQPITGHYSDRFEPKLLLAIGISLIAFSMIMFTLSTAFSFILASVVLLRIGSSFFHPVGVTAVSRSFDSKGLDSAMGFESAFGNVGVLSVFLVSAPLYILAGWRALFFLFSLIDVVVVVVTLVYLQTKRNHEAEQSSLANEVISGGPSPAKRLPIFFLLTMLISGGSYTVLTNYGNSLLAKSGFNVTEANFMISAWILSAFIGALVTGRLTRVISRTRLLTLSYALSSLTTVVFALFSSSLAISLPTLIVNGFFLSASYPLIYSELASYLGESYSHKGPLFGILFSAQIIGSVILGFFTGYLSEFYPLSFPFEIVAIVLLVATGSSVLWGARKKSEILA